MPDRVVEAVAVVVEAGFEIFELGAEAVPEQIWRWVLRGDVSMQIVQTLCHKRTGIRHSTACCGRVHTLPQNGALRCTLIIHLGTPPLELFALYNFRPVSAMRKPGKLLLLIVRHIIPCYPHFSLPGSLFFAWGVDFPPLPMYNARRLSNWAGMVPARPV